VDGLYAAGRTAVGSAPSYVSGLSWLTASPGRRAGRHACAEPPPAGRPNENVVLVSASRPVFQLAAVWRTS